MNSFIDCGKTDSIDGASRFFLPCALNAFNYDYGLIYLKYGATYTIEDSEMNRLLILLLVSLTLSGCSAVNSSYLEHGNNITKYNTLIIKDFGLDDLAYPGKDTEYQEKIYPIYLSAARTLSEDIARVVLAKKFFDTVNINDFSDKGAIVLEGKFLWFGKHLVAVKGQLVDGLTDEIVLFFQHEEVDPTGTEDLLRKMAEHIGMFLGATRCAQLPSFPFCPAQ